LSDDSLLLVRRVWPCLLPRAGFFPQLLGPSLVALLRGVSLFVYVMPCISRGSTPKQESHQERESCHLFHVTCPMAFYARVQIGKHQRSEIVNRILPARILPAAPMLRQINCR